MARATGFKNRWNSGEIGEDAWALSDLQQHANGMAQGLNFMGLALGPLARRPGTWYVGAPAYSALPCRPIPFVRSVDDCLCLELGHLYFRVRRADHSLVTETSTGLPIEIASPYSAADLPGLRWRQSGDIIVFFHRDGRRPMRLARRNIDSQTWDWAPYEFVNGPWRAENADSDFTISASGITGAVTLTATKPLFDPGMVGAQFRLRAATGTPGLKTWTADWDPEDNELAISNGRIYRDADAPGNTTKTGNTPPVHERGVVSDGKKLWEYVHDGAGIVQITDVIGAFSAMGTVIRTLPTTGDAQHKLASGANPAFPATSVWAEAAYSDYRGWPTAWPDFRDERLVVGGGAGDPDKFDATRVAGFNVDQADFTPGLGTGRVVDDDAVRNFVGPDSAQLLWVFDTARLLAGTHAGISTLSGGALDDPMTPDKAKPRGLTGYGASEAQPQKAGDGGVIYITVSGGLRELIVQPDLTQVGADLGFLAPHIIARGLEEIAWTGEPDYVLWARLADGGLASLVYNREQKVVGWNSHQLGGGWRVEYIAALPRSRTQSTLWLHVVREKNGAAQRAILTLSRREEGLRLDAAERYSGPAANGVDGLDHASGEHVCLMGANSVGGVDGWAEYRNREVVAGSVRLPEGVTFTEMVAGFEYLSRYVSLPGDLAGFATTMGKRQRVTQITVIAKGVMARAGVRLEDRERLEAFGERRPEDLAVIPYRRMVKSLPVTGGTDRDPRVVIEIDGGYDLILLALSPREVVND